MENHIMPIQAYSHNHRVGVKATEDKIKRECGRSYYKNLEKCHTATTTQHKHYVNKIKRQEEKIVVYNNNNDINI
jgi:hypothetical protein